TSRAISSSASSRRPRTPTASAPRARPCSAGAPSSTTRTISRASPPWAPTGCCSPTATVAPPACPGPSATPGTCSGGGGTRSPPPRESVPRPRPERGVPADTRGVTELEPIAGRARASKPVVSWIPLVPSITGRPGARWALAATLPALIASWMLAIQPRSEAASANPGPGDVVSAPGAREFGIGRLKYGGGGDWYEDRTSLRNLLHALAEQGAVPVRATEEAVVEPGSAALFQYPFIFACGHGNMKFTTV